MRVYHFVSREYGMDDLRRRRLKIATISDLNDPFELLCTDLSHPDLRRAMHDIKAELAKQFGMLCFSKDWHNPVQWSHYADKHRGFCFAFDVPDNTVVTVSYKRTRLAKEASELLRKKTTDEQTMLRLLSTKYHHWNYEKEVRAFLGLDEVDEDTGLYFAEFSDNLKLVGVIVGAMSTISRQELNSAIGETMTPLDIFKARLAFQSFRVVRQQEGRLWV